MKPINAVDILRDSSKLYATNLPTIVGAALLIQICAFVVNTILMNSMGFGGLMLTSFTQLIATQVSLGVMTLFLVSLRVRGETPSMSTLMRATLPRIPGLVVGAIMVSLCVGLIALAAMIPMLFFRTGILLIWPLVLAFIFYLRWSMTTPALIVQRIGPSQAMQTSRQITEGHLGSIFVLVLFQFLIGQLIPYFADHVSALPPVEVVLIAQAVFTGLLGPLVWLAIAEAYARLAGLDQPELMEPTTAPRGPWIPAARTAGPPAMGTAFVPTGPPAVGGGPAPYGAPPMGAPYGSPAMGGPGAPALYGAPQPSPYGAPPMGAPGAPAAYGAPQPAAYGAPGAAAPYGAPQPSPYGAPPMGAPGAPAPYGAPQPAAYGAPPMGAAPGPGAPAAYGAPMGAPQPAAYGAPTMGAPDPAAYGAPVAPAPHAAHPAGAPQPAAYSAPPAAPYGAPPMTPAPAPSVQMHAPAMPTAAMPGAPMHMQAPATSPYAAPPAMPGAPGVPAYGAAPGAPSGGPSGPVHPGREASVAPPGFG